MARKLDQTTKISQIIQKVLKWRTIRLQGPGIECSTRGIRVSPLFFPFFKARVIFGFIQELASFPQHMVFFKTPYYGCFNPVLGNVDKYKDEIGRMRYVSVHSPCRFSPTPGKSTMDSNPNLARWPLFPIPDSFSQVRRCASVGLTSHSP